MTGVWIILQGQQCPACQSFNTLRVAGAEIECMALGCMALGCTDPHSFQRSLEDHRPELAAFMRSVDARLSALEQFALTVMPAVG